MRRSFVLGHVSLNKHAARALEQEQAVCYRQDFNTATRQIPDNTGSNLSKQRRCGLLVGVQEEGLGNPFVVLSMIGVELDPSHQQPII